MEVFKIRLSELQMQGYCRQQEKRDLRTLHVFCIRAMKLEKFERSRSTVHVGAQDFVFKTTNIVARSELMAKKKMIKYRVCAIHILKKKNNFLPPCPSVSRMQQCALWEITFFVLSLSGFRLRRNQNLPCTPSSCSAACSMAWWISRTSSWLNVLSMWRYAMR